MVVLHNFYLCATKEHTAQKLLLLGNSIDGFRMAGERSYYSQVQ